jgi:hypothetical protein
MPTRRIGPSMRVCFSPSIAAKETDSHRPRPALASAVIKPVRKSTQRGLELRRQEIATLGTNLEATPITVDFDMESEVGPRHRQLQEGFDRIAACQPTWPVEFSQQINRVKPVVSQEPWSAVTSRLSVEAPPLLSLLGPCHSPATYRVAAPLRTSIQVSCSWSQRTGAISLSLISLIRLISPACARCLPL